MQSAGHRDLVMNRKPSLPSGAHDLVEKANIKNDDCAIEQTRAAASVSPLHIPRQRGCCVLSSQWAQRLKGGLLRPLRWARPPAAEVSRGTKGRVTSEVGFYNHRNARGEGTRR